MMKARQLWAPAVIRAAQFIQMQSLEVTEDLTANQLVDLLAELANVLLIISVINTQKHFFGKDWSALLERIDSG